MTCASYKVVIWIAGDIYQIEAVCRKYCLTGLCVTVTPTTFIYTGGAESGAAVGLINYARFPSDPESINGHAQSLARLLMSDCCQRSCSVTTPTESYLLLNEGINIPR